MNEMNINELFKIVVEENQTRKILVLLDECETVADAKAKIKALLNK